MYLDERWEQRLAGSADVNHKARAAEQQEQRQQLRQRAEGVPELVVREEGKVQTADAHARGQQQQHRAHEQDRNLVRTEQHLVPQQLRWACSG